MTTFVLVHGAWAGAHGFRLLRRRLQAAGHAVFTPSLTGLGERVHLASPQITLTTHVQDVVNQVLYEDLNDIVLLGYSYGGAVVTACLAHIADRIRHLVFLDAFVPGDGDTVLELAGLPRPPLAIGSPSFLPPAQRVYDDPAEAAFQNPRRVPHPIATALEAVRLAQPLDTFGFERSYIRATQSDPADVGYRHFAAAAAHARDSAAWHYHEIASNHMLPSNRPDELAALLLTMA